jgi:ankyrin repeat protein
MEFLLERGADPKAAKAGFTALHEAIMRRDEKMAAALLEHGADPNAQLGAWTPTRRSSHDYNFAPQLVGATPYWLAARFSEPGIMRLLLKHGADPKAVHDVVYVGERGLGPKGSDPFPPRKDSTTALMAATGMGGGIPWAQPPRAQREALTLEAVKLALEQGVDVNAANPEGSTALDGAKALKYQSVVQFLEEKGAKSGRPIRPQVRAE